MANHSASIHGLIIFDGTNFKQWSDSFEDCCLLNGVWQSMVTEPEDSDTTEEKFKLTKQEQMCLGILRRSLGDKYALVKDGCHPYFIFQKAKELFGKKTVNNAFFVNQKFHRSEIQTDESLVEFVDRMNLLRTELSGTKYEITDEAVIVKVMGCADRHWSDFFRSWRRDNGSDKQMNLYSFRNAIQEEELFAKQLSMDEPIKNVFYSNQRTKSQKQFKNFKNQKKSGFPCWKCGEIGHFKAQCKKNMNEMNSKIAFMASNYDDSEKILWIADSGATHHLCHELSMFTMLDTSKSEFIEQAGLDSKLECAGIGSIELTFKVSGKSVGVTLNNVYYVPTLRTNLLSLSQVCEKGGSVRMNSKGLLILMDGVVIAHARKSNGLFILDVEKKSMSVGYSKVSKSIREWHKVFGHASGNSIKAMAEKGIVDGLNLAGNEKLDDCKACIEGKMRAVNYKRVGERRTSKPLELVHVDLMGPITTESSDNHKYILVILDDYSNFVCTFILRTKSEATRKLKEWILWSENCLGMKLKILNSDNGGEFLNKDLDAYLKGKGIEHRLTIPYTPQQNGKVERMNQTLMNRTRCVLLDGNVDKSLWVYAVPFVAYTLNRTICTTTHDDNSTPYELWYGSKPDVSKMNEFGSSCYALRTKGTYGKLDSKADSCIFVGYCDNGYIVKSNESGKVFRSRNVKFSNSERVLVPKDKNKQLIVDPYEI